MMRPANLQIQYPSKKSKVSFSCGHIHLLKTKWTCWISTPGTDSRTPPKVSGQKSSIPTNFMDHMVGDSYTVYIYIIIVYVYDLHSLLPLNSTSQPSSAARPIGPSSGTVDAALVPLLAPQRLEAHGARKRRGPTWRAVERPKKPKK